MLAVYIQYKILFQNVHSPTLHPKGSQKLSNWHIFFLIVGRIYPIQIYILYMWPTTIWKSTNHHLNENLYIGSHNLSSSRLYFRPIHAPPQSDNLLWDSLKIIYGMGLFTYYVSQKQGFLHPPPPSVSNGQHLAYPASPPRQPSSAFSRRPYCTTIFDVDFLTW